MQILSIESSAGPVAVEAPRAPELHALEPRAPELRDFVRLGDAPEVERLVRATGVFSDAEASIARELVEETLAKGEATGYRFLMAHGGAAGLDGYTCFGPIPATNGRYELYWIAVDPEARRHGLGRVLLRGTENAALSLGGTHLFAETSTRADYAPAHAFYAAEGYTLYGVVPDYHGDGDGLAIFGKRL